ncbi:MAG TPA: hypothetical protein ENJ06_00830 [Phycisphaeraceae bacterium]|nr:hypothetical protein [Phycisphaeraceae bacterium]
MLRGCVRFAYALAGAALLAVSATPAPAQDAQGRVRYDGYHLVSVQIDNQEQLDRMLEIAPLFMNCKLVVGGHDEFAVPADRMQDLQQSGLTYTVLNENLQNLIDQEQQANQQGGRGWFDSYHRYSEINDYMDGLVTAHPDLVSKFSIGQSIEGRTIYAMRITSTVGSNKPQIFFNGCQHAREWISPAVVMYIADQLANGYGNDPEVTSMLDRVEFLIVPLVNPDGYEYTHTTNRFWRKNRRNNGGGIYGVDLNRNWTVGWGGSGSSGDPSSDVYHGTSAFSEPETQAVRDFVLSQPNIIAHIDFHSYSQLVLRPYGYAYLDPPEPDNTTLTDLGDGMANAIFSIHGKSYTSEPSYDLYLAGGDCTDWHYGANGILSWTIELRDTGFYGFELPAGQIIPTGEENFEAVKYLADYLSLQLKFTYPDGLPALVNPDTPTIVNVQISEISGTYQSGSAKQYTRIGNSGAWTEAPMNPLGGDMFQAVLPPAPCGQVIQYYFSADTTGGSTYYDPEGAPAQFYQSDVLPVVVVRDDDMETDQGWTVGAPDDDATTGIWGRMDPQGTEAQPENDHTPAPGTDCYVTDGRAGSGLGTYDIDNGKTTLYSPVFDASQGSTTVSYWRWYSNDKGADPNNDVFTIDISDNGGSTWHNAETIGPAGAGTGGGWIYHQFNVADIPGLNPTANMKMRFVAADENAGSIVEAALDDFQVISEGQCDETCAGDLDGDGDIDQSDLGILLSAYGMNDGGDIDGDGDTDQADLGALLSVYGTNCP